jgi:hypothetical protein
MMIATLATTGCLTACAKLAMNVNYSSICFVEGTIADSVAKSFAIPAHLTS